MRNLHETHSSEQPSSDKGKEEKDAERRISLFQKKVSLRFRRRFLSINSSSCFFYNISYNIFNTPYLVYIFMKGRKGSKKRPVLYKTHLCAHELNPQSLPASFSFSFAWSHTHIYTYTYTYIYIFFFESVEHKTLALVLFHHK